VIISLRVIRAYFIGEYWWLFMVIILVAIGGYYVNVYLLLYFIGGYFIDGYWWLFY
jgi:hypothetical protein